MTTFPVHRGLAEPLLGASLALLVTACLTPPGHPGASPGGGATPAAARPGPRPFTRSSAELVASLHLGWNLGNSLDVPGGETAWGNPKVTPELLRAVAEAGFDLVRIPVTWAPHTGPGPDFVIEPAWLERVDEVVGYAHAAGLYAIINLHHDGAEDFAGVEWLTLNDAAGNPTPENDAAVRARFEAVWGQIARHFAGYGEELLFESMNEIHVGYGAPDPRHLAFVNDLNQRFVRLVRASGGHNAERHLVVPGYNTNIEHTVKAFTLPQDPTPDRLVVTVHFYDPYLFALQAKTHTWGRGAPGRDDWGQEEHVVAQFDLVQSTFVDRGIPVIIGEYGATHQAGYEDYRRYYLEYVTKAASDRGILPVYWDNGSRNSGGESFGLFDRRTGKVLHPKALEAMLRAATHDYSLADVAPPKPSR
ncbi:MAG TPA: glycoside hydrolase family 5 protein [Polyangiaceae bacterium]|nr:glycoside hydrolase family 5 protein [Polyangiaceae bacterium]